MFEFVMYAIATVIALYLADAICDEMDGNLSQTLVKEVTTTRSVAKAEPTPLILNLQMFELNGTLVVKKSDLPVALPDGVKAVTLRGDPAIRLTDLQKVYGTVGIDVEQVICKWEQWSKKNKKKKKPRNALVEAATLSTRQRSHESSSALTA